MTAIAPVVLPAPPPIVPPLLLRDSPPVAGVSLSEVLAAMSRALDMTEGEEAGHTVRTCIIGMRIAEELDLSAFDRVALYGAMLLKDTGSSGNSQLVAQILEVSELRPKRRLSLRRRATSASP